MTATANTSSEYVDGSTCINADGAEVRLTPQPDGSAVLELQERLRYAAATLTVVQRHELADALRGDTPSLKDVR